ncbi:MAG: hypothetical protein IMW89_14835 [Ktedonobacteraceae bacterium]|nr:hypothetical protein [Ktedonobacteraceae bacterium]
MLHWERCLCPECTLVWERNLDGAWRYIALVAVPLPQERPCPLCASNLSLHWEKPLPALPLTEE